MDSWTAVAPMPTGRYGASTWTSAGDMPGTRDDAVAARAPDGTIYVVTGTSLDAFVP